MRVQITYIASSGNSYNLIANGIIHKKAKYHSWDWDVKGTKLQYGIRVADFARDPAVYDIELLFYGSVTKRRKLLYALHDDWEADVRNETPGTLIWGDYYITGYVKSSDMSPTEIETRTSNKIEFYAPYPFWVQDAKISITAPAVSAGSYLDYPYDYPYDYTAPVVGTKIVKSDFPFASEFKMIIYGQAVNPRITINGYSYVLYTTIPSGAYVIIDSRTKSIMQYNTDGTQSNMFNYRNKTDSIFEKIPGGNLTITWDASFGADITVFRERSEPRIEVST